MNELVTVRYDYWTGFAYRWDYFACQWVRTPELNRKKFDSFKESHRHSWEDIGNQTEKCSDCGKERDFSLQPEDEGWEK